MSELEHYDHEIYELDAHIGRLALACGADLSRAEIVVGLIQGRYEVCLQRDNLSKAKLFELRGLLMLKYKIEKAYAEEFGLADFDRLVAKQDAQLRLRGFPAQSLADVDGKK